MGGFSFASAEEIFKEFFGGSGGFFGDDDDFFAGHDDFFNVGFGGKPKIKKG